MDYSKIYSDEGYIYIPYLGIFVLKIEGMYLSLVHTLFRSKARKIITLHHVRKVKIFQENKESSGFHSLSSFCNSWIISAFVGRASIEPNFVRAKAPAAEANSTAPLTSSFTAQ